jgi:hypothetical protein
MVFRFSGRFSVNQTIWPSCSTLKGSFSTIAHLASLSLSRTPSPSRLCVAIRRSPSTGSGCSAKELIPSSPHSVRGEPFGSPFVQFNAVRPFDAVRPEALEGLNGSLRTGLPNHERSCNTAYTVGGQGGRNDSEAFLFEISRQLRIKACGGSDSIYLLLIQKSFDLGRNSHHQRIGGNFEIILHH